MSSKVLGPKENFLALDEKISSLENSKFVIFPVAYERTTSYQKGAALGPKALLKASHQLEFYDEELEFETSNSAAIATLPILHPKPKETTEAFFKKLTEIVDDLLKLNKFVITIGGEHSLSYAPLVAFARRFPNLAVLHFDAHADLRETYENTAWSHACALRRMLDVVQRAVLIGVRSFDKSEADWIAANSDRVTLFLDDQCQSIDKALPKITEALGEEVYITIDVDGFDPSLMPATGTSQPGGFSWHDALKLFREVFRTKKVVGFDVMELAPQKNSVVSEFTAAKLLYRLMGYAWKYQRSRHLFSSNPPKANSRNFVSADSPRLQSGRVR